MVAANPSKILFSEWMIGGVLTLFFLVGYIGDWKFLRTIEYFTYDLRAPLRENPKPTDQIVIVGVDDDSITKIGRWPWPRSVIGQLIDKLREGGAKVIGVGFLFSEPDQAQGVQELRAIHQKVAAQADSVAAQLEAANAGNAKVREAELQLRQSQLTGLRAIVQDLTEAEARLDQDGKLAEAIATTPQVVLPMFFEIGKPLGNETDDPPAPILANAVDEVDNPRDLNLFPLIETKKMTPPLPAFQHDGVALGHINIRPDEDGVVRRELLLLEHRNHFYPSFALRAVSAYLNLPPNELHVMLGSHVSAGAIQIPTDPLMRLRVSFNGPAGTFKAFSAYEVLEGKIPSDTFKGKLVLMGPLATGIADRNVTPVAPSIPGVEVVANVAQNILEQNFLTVPPWAPAFELLALVVVGAFLIVGLPRLSALMAGIVAGVILLGYLGVAAFVFAAHGSIVTVLHPTLLLTLGYTVITSRRFLVTEKHKELVEADSIETNKMLGLSFQGQGMLDLAFEKFRKCPLDESVMGLLYNLALDFERKRMFNKAVAIYQHIATKQRRFKDIEERMKRLQEVGETMIFGAGGLKKGAADATVMVEHGGVKPTLGRYEVVRELGRGAMGIVYLGKDPKIQRSVAIKTMRLDEVDPDQLAEVKERFFREAESAGRLSHPNIVTIYDAGEEQELGYIAMEVLEGADLKDWCKKETLLPVKQTLEIVAKVADALDYAHGQGIVHRDIKPANVMLLKDGTVKVTDFGIARITASSKTQTGVVLGTPSYMSPEQLAGTKVDGRSDLFSLGVVLFEMLTGEKPFQADSVATLMFQIANQPHQSPTKVRPDLPPGCQAIIDKALQKDTTQRYQRGQEMAQDLRACLQQLG
jgi:serine/threonine-protein kinase